MRKVTGPPCVSAPALLLPREASRIEFLLPAPPANFFQPANEMPLPGARRKPEACLSPTPRSANVPGTKPCSQLPLAQQRLNLPGASPSRAGPSTATEQATPSPLAGEQPRSLCWSQARSVPARDSVRAGEPGGPAIVGSTQETGSTPVTGCSVRAELVSGDWAPAGIAGCVSQTGAVSRRRPSVALTPRGLWCAQTCWAWLCPSPGVCGDS